MRLMRAKLDEAKARQPAERAQRVRASGCPRGGRMAKRSCGRENTAKAGCGIRPSGTRNKPDDPRVQKMYVARSMGARLGLSDITPRPLP